MIIIKRTRKAEYEKIFILRSDDYFNGTMFHNKSELQDFADEHHIRLTLRK